MPRSAALSLGTTKKIVIKELIALAMKEARGGEMSPKGYDGEEKGREYSESILPETPAYRGDLSERLSTYAKKRDDRSGEPLLVR